MWLICGQHIVQPLLGFVPPLQATLLLPLQADRSWGAHPSQPYLTDVLDTDLRRGATLLAPPKQGSEWCFWWELQLI